MAWHDHPRGRVVLAATCLTAASFGLQAPAAATAAPAQGQDTEPYVLLDDSPSTVHNFNVETTSSLDFTTDGTRLYALNPWGNTVCVFTDASGQPSDVFPVPLGPTALALRESAGEVLVLCKGTECLARIDMFSGAPVDLIPLRGEPADLAYDAAADRAWLTCEGIDTVVQVDFATDTLTEHVVAGKRPRFVELDASGNALVTPMLSGNNSTRVGGPGNSTIVDLDDPAVSTQGLPDADLFRITPAGVVEVLLTGAGTLLFDHGLNPSTGEYWIVNVACKNKDPNKQTEPDVSGDFADNRVTIATVPPSGPFSISRIVDLDDVDPQTPGRQVDPARSVANPYGLIFSSSGFALVSGSTNDVVALLDPGGDRIWDYTHPAGSVVRDMALDPTESLLVTHAWNTNQVFVWNVLAPGQTPLVLDLGLDATHPTTAAGRAVAYDARNSRDNRSTCLTCHTNMLADGLAWNLSDGLKDSKGPMVTQPLTGLRENTPLHWRGERIRMEDFNVAFPGLLGAADVLDPQTFAAFEEFVFSVRTPSNPSQDRRRLIHFDPGADPQPNGLVGDPIEGSFLYHNDPVDAGTTCVGCHHDPTGGSGDQIIEINSDIPRRVSQDVTAFNNGTLGLKDQDLVQIDIGGNTFDRTELGFGTLHTGGQNRFFDFVSAFAFDPQEIADVTSFLEVFDQGLPPMGQGARQLDMAGVAAGVDVEIRELLLGQARRGWIDVVARGEFPVGGSPALLGFLYDPVSGRFHCEDPAIPSQSLNDLATLASSGQANLFVYGVPPGNGRRVALDFDNDGLLNGLEPFENTSRWDPDSDGDGWPDGYEVVHGSEPDDDQSVPVDGTDPVFTQEPVLMWNNATVAKYTFRTDEPCTVTVDYQSATSGPLQYQSSDPDTVHIVVLQNLEPSTGTFITQTYNGTITVTDLQGNDDTRPLPTTTTNSRFFATTPPFGTILAAAEIANAASTPTTFSGTARFLTEFRAAKGIPLADRVVAATVFVNGQPWSSFTSNHATSFDVDGTPYTGLPGPFLVTTASTVTGTPATDGWVEVGFTISGLTAGDEIEIVAQLVGDPLDVQTYDPQAPDLSPVAGILWDMPETLKEHRAVSHTF